jgi:hypothetical protein
VENGCAVWVEEVEDAVVVEIPDWTHMPYIRSQVFLLMEAVCCHFKQLHCVLTIPYEEIEESTNNEHVIRMALELIRQRQDRADDEVSSFMSIFLTKIEDESALELFN